MDQFKTSFLMIFITPEHMWSRQDAGSTTKDYARSQYNRILKSRCHLAFLTRHNGDVRLFLSD
jgi:hypothetical protein